MLMANAPTIFLQNKHSQSSYSYLQVLAGEQQQVHGVAQRRRHLLVVLRTATEKITKKKTISSTAIMIHTGRDG